MKNLNKWQEKTKIKEPSSKFRINQAGKPQKIGTKQMTSMTFHQSQTASNAARKQLEPNHQPKNQVSRRDQKDDPESHPSQRETLPPQREVGTTPNLSQRETLLPQRKAGTPSEGETVIEMDASQREMQGQGIESTPEPFPNTDGNRKKTDTAVHARQIAPTNAPDRPKTGCITRTAEDKLME